MDLTVSPEDEAFREEIRSFVAENLPADIRDKVRQGVTVGKADIQRWTEILNVKGWVAPAWPVEHGGPGWSTSQIFIFNEEMVNGHAPGLNPFGVPMLAPVLISFGSEAQKAHYLPRILSGEDWWCQGYSEPNAGSDLASLSTRAVRHGDDYIVNGTKMWTTWAQYANWIFCLVRTSTEGKKQAGISFLLIHMKKPGITVRPVITIEGGHEVNQVFFEDVRVPVENLVGEENQGWTYAKVLLGHERFMSAGVANAKRALAKLKEIAANEQSRGRPLIKDSRFRERIADVETEIMAIEYSTLRFIAAAAKGDHPGSETSLLKLRGSQVRQRLSELTFEAAGHYAAPLASSYFNDRKVSIYSGSNEIQKNIMAKFVLGL